MKSTGGDPRQQELMDLQRRVPPHGDKSAPICGGEPGAAAEATVDHRQVAEDNDGIKADIAMIMREF